MRAAIQLWTERGFEHGFEDTTVEEIAQAAGVTKGTFHFHFAHKHDVLRELGWGTAEALYQEALRGAASRRSGLAVLRGLLGFLARRVESVPRAVVARSAAEFYRSDYWAAESPRRRDIHDGLAVALDAAAARGEIPSGTDTDELARMLSALVMDALVRWAQGDRRRLRVVLRRRVEAVLAGLEAARATPGEKTGPTRTTRD